MYIQIDLAERHTKKIEAFVLAQMPEQLEEILFKNDGVELRKIIKSCVKGGLSMVINEILQDKKYKTYLKEQVEEVLGISKEG